MMESIKSVPIIDGVEVEKYLEFQALFDAIEKAFVNYSEGRIIQPIRSVVPVEKHHGWFGSMPAFSSGDDVLATKLVTFYSKNGEKGLPSHASVVLLFNAETGFLKAIIDGDPVTNLRTAMASGVATKHLANPNSKILAIIGCGVQAKSHWKVLSQLYNFEEVRIWSRTKANSEKFASETGAIVCDTVEEAARNADIICTVTSSTVPVLFASHVKDGAHINGVGACIPTSQELESELMRKAIVVTDSKAGCEAESGDLVLSGAEVYAEIGEIIAKKKQVPAGRITIFDSLGMAVEDAVSAKIIYEKYSADRSSKP